MFKKILVVGLAIFPIILIAGFFWWKTVTSAPSNNPQEARVVIVKGASAERIANALEEAGVVKSAFAFKLYLQLKGMTTSIPTGEFEIPQNLSVAQVVTKLLEGPTEVWVTIPEGLRYEQYPDFFINALNLSGTEAIEFRQAFLTAAQAYEGRLFPDTYLVPKDITPVAAVNILTSTFETVFKPEWKAELSRIGLDQDQVVILASLIERETINNEERPVVAGIMFNRLREGWPLQIDATIQYIMANASCDPMDTTSCTWWSKNITKLDLEIDSLYNTYLYPGLPPGPIANPGRSSLEAVIFPEQTDYWFYLHDESGQIHYAKTLQEHNQNIQQYLR